MEPRFLLSYFSAFHDERGRPKEAGWYIEDGAGRPFVGPYRTAEEALYYVEPVEKTENDE